MKIFDKISRMEGTWRKKGEQRNERRLNWLKTEKNGYKKKPVEIVEKVREREKEEEIELTSEIRTGKKKHRRFIKRNKWRRKEDRKKKEEIKEHQTLSTGQTG